jgi:hypothetical protein
LHFEPTTALGEPELRGDVGVDEGLEHVGDGLADQHSGFCYRHLLEL